MCIISKSRAVKLCKIMYTICMQVWTLECVGRVGTIKIFNPPSVSNHLIMVGINWDIAFFLFFILSFFSFFHFLPSSG